MFAIYVLNTVSDKFKHMSCLIYHTHFQYICKHVL